MLILDPGKTSSKLNCYAGFVQQFAAVCQPDRADTNIAAVLKELSGGKSPNRVICCGHSLGGALATLGTLPYGPWHSPSSLCVALVRPQPFCAVLVLVWC